MVTSTPQIDYRIESTVSLHRGIPEQLNTKHYGYKDETDLVRFLWYQKREYSKCNLQLTRFENSELEFYTCQTKVQ